MPEFPIFTGNCPANVAKDAKYAVRGGPGGPVVGLTYRAEDDERWHPTTDQHPDLVKRVNEVKLAYSGMPNGAFYINEYQQVIVPAGEQGHYYYAGDYSEPLRFEFEGKILSGEPHDLVGNPLSPGDEWVGPHPGIPYVLAAGGRDIRYRYSPRPNVTKDVKLSKKIGPQKAALVARRILDIKGFQGGRFYVNEFRSIFTPMQEGYETRYIYVGLLDLDEWFPKPELPQ